MPPLVLPMLLALLANPALAGEKALAASALPAAIQTAVAAGYPSATIVEASTEVEEGVTTYEVGIKLGDRSVDLAYKADGTQLEEEEIVALASVPRPAQATVATYTGWTVKRVERATANGVTTYEVLMVQGKKRMELFLDEAGIIKSKERSAHDDEQ